MVASEYGKALFELALEKNKSEIIEDNFNTFIAGLRNNPDYIKVLTYPRISNNQKKDSIKQIGSSFDIIFKNFLYVIIDNQRMSDIYTIYEEYTNCLLENRNILNVSIISPEKLSSKQENELIAQLTKFYQGKKIEVSNIIDSSLIGGIKVIANGEALDLSLQHKLEQLKATI